MSALFYSWSFPMLRDVAEPGDAGGFEGDVWIQTPRDGAVDDGLLLLVEQRHQLLLRSNRPLNPPVCVVKETHDSILLVARRTCGVNQFEMFRAETPHIRRDSVRPTLRFFGELRRAVKMVEIPGVLFLAQSHDDV